MRALWMLVFTNGAGEVKGSADLLETVEMCCNEAVQEDAVLMVLSQLRTSHECKAQELHSPCMALAQWDASNSPIHARRLQVGK